MINTLSNKIVNWLLSQNVIQTSEVEIYRYAAFNIIFAALPVIMMLIIGIFLNILLGSVLFISTYIMLRKYTGGFHFKKLIVSLIISPITEFVFIFIASKPLPIWLNLVSLLVSTISLSILSPISSESRPLDSTDIQNCRRKLKKILVFLCILCYSLYITDGVKLMSFPISAMTMTAILQYPALIKSRGEQHNATCRSNKSYT